MDRINRFNHAPFWVCPEIGPVCPALSKILRATGISALLKQLSSYFGHFDIAELFKLYFHDISDINLIGYVHLIYIYSNINIYIIDRCSDREIVL